MVNLRQARDQGKLAEFIKEHRGDAPGDADALDRTLTAMAGRPKHTPEKPK